MGRAHRNLHLSQRSSCKMPDRESPNPAYLLGLKAGTLLAITDSETAYRQVSASGKKNYRRGWRHAGTKTPRMANGRKPLHPMDG